MGSEPGEGISFWQLEPQTDRLVQVLAVVDRLDTVAQGRPLTPEEEWQKQGAGEWLAPVVRRGRPSRRKRHAHDSQVEAAGALAVFGPTLSRVDTTRLFRPVGQPERDLIESGGSTAFPPRLDWQPIFYPVLTEHYATRIARDWNTKDELNGRLAM
jgi:hypothetical protein